MVEYVTVTYPEKRTVFIDGEEAGCTNTTLRVDEGTHNIHLGEPRDYAPKWRRPTLTGTTSTKPMEVLFEKA
jgi:hypothetical protein